MEIIAVILMTIGIGAAILNLFINADPSLPRCPVCSAELEADLTDWALLYGERQIGVPLYYLECAHCKELSWQKPGMPVNEEAISASSS